MRAALAVAKLQFKLLVHDPWFVLIMFAMPVVVMPLFRGLIETSLESSGIPMLREPRSSYRDR